MADFSGFCGMISLEVDLSLRRAQAWGVVRKRQEE